MKSLTRYLIAALLISYVGFCARTYSQAKAPRKSSVGGLVTIKGKPAPGVVVSLRTSDYGYSPLEPPFKATTDQEGKYRINDVPAGSYQVIIIAPAFVASSRDNLNRTLVLSDGEDVQGIDFSLVRGGVVTGKVTDADGQPVIEQRVSLVAADLPPNQQGNVMVFGGVQTDDRGVYRMFGIAAGRYKVVAGEAEEGFINTNSARPSYKLSFHTEASDSSDAARASVIEVTEGGEASHIDITLGSITQTFAAGGRIVDGETGQSIPAARFVVQRIVGERRSSFVGAANSFSNSNGEFRVENLPPGKYSVFMATQSDSELRSEAVPFEIVDQEVNGLLIKTTKGGATLSGNVVLDNAQDKALFARLTQLKLTAFVQKPGTNPSPNMAHTATINPDGSFRIGGLEPGVVFISLFSSQRNLMKGFSVSRTEQNGVVEPRGIEIKNDDQITGIRLVVSYGNSTILGVVTFGNDPFPAGAHIYIRIRKEGNTTPMQSPQVDARGHFIVPGIPAGLYHIDTQLFTPGVVARPQQPVTQTLNVSDGAITEVTITLSTPKPEATPP